MSNKLLSVAGITLAALIFLTLGAFGFALSSDKDASGIVSQQNVGIWVTGNGEVSVIPDITVLNLGVYVQMDSLEAAQAQAAESMAAIMAVTETYNIDKKDIQTTNYNISPAWSWDKDGNRFLYGYCVSNTITVKVRNTDQTGSIIDAVVDAGGEHTVINGINFTVDNPEVFYEEARSNAIANAVAKANQIAELTGVTLGKPTYIMDNSSYYGPIYRYVAYDSSMGKTEGHAPTDISTGEIKIITGIQIVFDIK
ncbi:MAG: SIMPL domain-containing protein [Dehalococcoidales bacterium]